MISANAISVNRRENVKGCIGNVGRMETRARMTSVPYVNVRRKNYLGKRAVTPDGNGKEPTKIERDTDVEKRAGMMEKG